MKLSDRQVAELEKLVSAFIAIQTEPPPGLREVPRMRSSGASQNTEQEARRAWNDWQEGWGG